jgi:hypothetical protein
MARIGFIGLGNMGLPMAQNLVKAGYEVSGFDVVAASIDKLVAAGGKAAVDVIDAVRDAEIVITMLPSGKEARAIYLAPDGLIAKALPGTLLIDCSTIDVWCALDRRRSRGARLADARRAGVRRRRRRPRRDADLHGGRQRRCVCKAEPCLHRSRGGPGKRPGREDLQQYGARRFHDHRLRSVRAR